MSHNEVSEEQSSIINQSSRQISKKTPIQERSIVAGSFVIINGYRVNLVSLKQRFVERGYQAHETPHFLLFLRDESPSVIVVHWFAPEEMDADVKHYLTQELKPYGIITQSQHYGEILSRIVGSLFPDDVRRPWRYFEANTLQRFLTLLWIGNLDHHRGAVKGARANRPHLIAGCRENRSNNRSIASFIKDGEDCDLR